MWTHLKEITRSIYANTKSKNWLYFFTEAEFRLNIIKRSNDEKLNIFKDILKIVYELHEYDFYSIDELIAFDNYDN